MSQTSKTDAPAFLKETLTSHLRDIQLLTRILMICSCVEGFQMQASDIQSLSKWLLNYITDVQKTLEEVKS